MFPTTEFLFLLLFIPFLWFWVDGMRARERAVRAAARACEEEGWQLLDETVSSVRVRPQRCEDGSLGLRRDYRFEFTDTGDNRRSGHLTVEGGQVKLLQLHPHLYIVPRIEQDTD